MMNHTNLGNSYRAVAVQTASKGHLILMLFDGSIRFLEQALIAFEYDDPLEFNQTIHNNVIRAQAIIRELNESLNMEAGGEIAATLRRLYEYMDWRLFESNVAKESDGIIDVRNRLTVIRDAWNEMLSSQRISGPALTAQ